MHIYIYIYVCIYIYIHIEREREREREDMVDLPDVGRISRRQLQQLDLHS